MFYIILVWEFGEVIICWEQCLFYSLWCLAWCCTYIGYIFMWRKGNGEKRGEGRREKGVKERKNLIFKDFKFSSKH